MASAQVDVDSEMKNMVMCFRVSELQVLLGHAGRNKSGRKHELMSRALQLIRSSGCNKAIQAKIIDLYSQRYPHHNSQYNSKSNFSSPPIARTDADLDRQPDRLLTDNQTGYHDGRDDSHLDAYVQFKPLPFFEHISEILRPTALNPNPRTMQASTFKFKINSQQGQTLRYSKRDLNYHSNNSVQIQLRFCLLDTSCEQSDKLPPNLNVKVNRCVVILPAFIPPTKTGVDPRRPNRPLDITSLCRTSSHDDCTIDVRWSTESGKPSQSYALTINLVRQLSVDDLLGKLKQPGVLHASESRALIRQKLKKDPDAEIATTSLKVSLLCPLGKMRMKIPTRPKTCRHLQCFDATLFLMMNEKKPTWVCPVCDKPADFRKLMIDGLFTEILDSSDTDEIEFTEDGNWHCARKNTETLVIGTPTKPIDKKVRNSAVDTATAVIDLSLDGSVDEAIKTERSEVSKKIISDQSKCDKSETFSICKKQKKHSDLSQSGCKAAEEKRSSKEPEVIDLTCDSSDEEPEKISSPSQNSDGIPMSVTSSPIEVGSPNVKPSTLDVPLSNYTSTCRRSPTHHKTSSLARNSPARSPYYRTESPYYRPGPLLRFSPNTPESAHRTPPLHQPTSSSHSSPYSSANGPVDTPPISHIPSPLVSATPPSVGGSHPPLSQLELGMNGYHTPPLSLSMGFPSHPPFDLFNTRQFYDPFTNPALTPFFMPPHLPPLTAYDLYGRGVQMPVSSAETRTHNQPQRYQDEDLNYNLDAIPID